MKANKKDKNKSKWHSQASHLHLIVPFPRPHIEAMRSTPILFDANQPRILGKKKRGEKKEKKKKDQNSCILDRDIYFPRGDANKNGIGVFRLIDKTVAAGCNSFPYHWPSSRSGYRGRCTLRARSSFHRLRSSRIEHWLSSDRPRRRSESFACTRLVVASKMTFIGPRGYSVDRPWPRHVHVWRVMWTSCTWKSAVRASMSISQESAATIVCKEIFDGVSHPSDEGTWKNHEFKITDHRMPASSNPVLPSLVSRSI